VVLVVVWMSAGTSANDGGVVSWTVMWKEALEEFPAASIAEQFTVVVPIPNVEPVAGVQLELVTPTASVNVTVYPTGAPDGPVASAVMSAGTVICGAVVSCTFTWNVEVALLECASVAVQVTVVVPSANVEPDAGAQCTVTEPSTVSVAVGVA
jgi:hypothetical protein